MTLMFLLELKHAPGICFFVVVFLQSPSSLWVEDVFIYTLSRTVSLNFSRIWMVLTLVVRMLLPPCLNKCPSLSNISSGIFCNVSKSSFHFSAYKVYTWSNMVLDLKSLFFFNNFLFKLTVRVKISSIL